MIEIGGRKLPYVGLSINELRYLTELDSVHFGGLSYRKLDSIPERLEISQIGLMYPLLYDFKHRIGLALSWLSESTEAIPLMAGFSKEYVNRWAMVGSLTNEDIDIAASRRFLPFKYAGPLKLRERIHDFDEGLGIASFDKEGSEDLVNKALQKGLISHGCAAELLEKGVWAISPLQVEHTSSSSV